MPTFRLVDGQMTLEVNDFQESINFSYTVDRFRDGQFEEIVGRRGKVEYGVPFPEAQPFAPGAPANQPHGAYPNDQQAGGPLNGGDGFMNAGYPAGGGQPYNNNVLQDMQLYDPHLGDHAPVYGAPIAPQLDGNGHQGYIADGADIGGHHDANVGGGAQYATGAAGIGEEDPEDFFIYARQSNRKLGKLVIEGRNLFWEPNVGERSQFEPQAQQSVVQLWHCANGYKIVIQAPREGSHKLETEFRFLLNPRPNNFRSTQKWPRWDEALAGHNSEHWDTFQTTLGTIFPVVYEGECDE